MIKRNFTENWYYTLLYASVILNKKREELTKKFSAFVNS